MARKRQKLDNKGEAEELLSLYKKEPIAWRKERLQVIKLLLETEKSFAEVAKIVSRAPSRVKLWAKLFREGGLEALLNRGKSTGRKPKAKEEVREALTEKLRSGEFRTAKQIESWLKEEFQITYGKNSIYYELKKLGGRLKVPRPSHTKKDEKKVAEFKENLADKLDALNLPKEKKVSLWVYDEMRYGLHPLLRKMWSLVGHRVVAPVNRRFDWGYLFGAMEVSTGKGEFLYTDRVLKCFDRAFIEQVANSNPNKIHVIIGDGAGFHHRENADHENPLPENVRIITLPPYSPELNPMEKFWDVIKDKICTRCWDSIEELEAKITEVLHEWWNKPGQFRSLFTNSYLRSELNAIYRLDKSCSLY